MTYRPTVRPHWYNDYEDRVMEDTVQVWMTIPTPYDFRVDAEAGLYFREEAEWVFDPDHGSEPSDPMYDKNLRRSALCEQPTRAMNLLSLFRYECGLFAESARWARRALWHIDNSPRDESDGSAAADREFCIDMFAKCEAEGVVLRDYPLDVLPDFAQMGLAFCLTCGSLKNRSAPLEQCDDSVHLSPRAFF